MPNRSIILIYGKLLSRGRRLLSTGVREGMPFIEARRITLLNLLSLPAIPFTTFYMLLNFWQERYVLGWVNFIITLNACCVLYLHSRQKYLSARLLLILCSIVIYTFAGIYFQNGAEYFLLNILIITLLIYDNLWIKWTFSLLTILCFLFIHFRPLQANFAPPIPTERVWLNVLFSLVFIIIALSYFKQLHADYIKITESQRKALALLNSDKEKMFSIVAHEIRSPLSTLKGLLELFQDGNFTEEEMNDAIVILHKKINHLGDSLDNLLRWSISQMRGIKAQPVQFDIEKMLQKILEIKAPSIEQKNIQIHCQVSPSAEVFADPDQTDVILRNLISNALKFSHPGTIIYIRSNSNHSRVQIEVQDEGIGMRADQLDTLFTFRAEPDYGTQGERGAGLGLMLCKEFAELNHGELSVISRPKEGTTFVLILPKQKKEFIQKT